MADVKLSVADLRKKQADIQKAIDNPKTTDATRNILKATLPKVEAAIKAAEAEEEKAKAEADKKPKPESVGGGKRVRRTREQLEKDGYKPKKAAAEQKKDKAEAKPAEKKEITNVIQVLKDGKTVEFDLENFDEACTAYMARKERDKQTSKKSKSRLPGVKAKGHVEDTISSIEEMLPADFTDAEGKKIITALTKFEELQEKSFEVLTSVIGKANVDRLKSALKEVNTVIADIKKELKEAADKKK